MTREDIAKAYIQTAQTRAANTGVIAFGVALALGTLWYAEMSSRSGQVIDALAHKTHRTEISRKRASLQKDAVVGVEQLAAIQNQKSKKAAKATDYVAGLRQQEARLATLEQKLSDQSKKAATVVFKLPGFPEIEVRDTAAAFVWLSFAALLLWYVAWSRRTVLTLYSRALRIFVSELDVDPGTLQDIAGPLPFWIAPLPRQDGNFVSVSLLKSAAGWDRSNTRNYACVAGIHLFAGLIVLNVVYLGIVVSQLTLQPRGGAWLVRNTPFLSVTVIVGLTFAAIVLWWLSPGRVPDNYSSERPSAQVANRRSLLLAGIGLLGAAALIAVSPDALRKAILRPRFRKWTNHGDLAKGFHEVGRKKTVHYARGGNRPKRLKSVPDKYIQLVEPALEQVTRIHPSALTTWIPAAMARLKISEMDLAMEGITRTISFAATGGHPHLVWFEQVANSARARRQPAEIQRVLDLLGNLAATTGGKAIGEEIDRRRRIWSGWLMQLARRSD